MSLGGVVGEDGRYEVDGHPVGPAALYEAHSLVEWLDSVGLDQAWVSLPPPLFRQGLDPRESVAWVAAANDGLLSRVDGHPRLRPLAYLPLDRPEQAHREVLRVGTDQRFVGWAAAAGGGSLPLDAEALQPVWSAVESSGRALLLHPGTTPDARLDAHYLANLLGNPVETAVAAAQLVFGDVLGRHSLRVLLVHCGGCVPAVVGRWMRGFETARPGVGQLTLAPKDAVRRCWVDSLAHDPAVIDLALRVFGPDRIVLGSDWPFPMGSPDPGAVLAHLAPALQERVATTNAAGLLGDLA